MIVIKDYNVFVKIVCSTDILLNVKDIFRVLFYFARTLKLLMKTDLMK